MNKKIVLYYLLLQICLFGRGCDKNEGSEITAVESFPLPDISENQTGKGFTATGLAYDTSEQVFYIGNCGKMIPDEINFKATIVKISNNWSEKIGEIELYKIFPGMDDIQGLTIDTRDNSIWFCSFGENKVRHITKDGEILGEFHLDQANGIAYDHKNDSLWILTPGKLLNTDKNGGVLKKFTFSYEGQDQIFLDEKNNIIYFTAGNNYQEPNDVYAIDLSTGHIKKKYTLKDSYAVEGIFIDDHDMYILNDGYYHNAKVPVNCVNHYRINN